MANKKNNKFSKKHNGFTLIEIIVYVALFGIVVSVVLDVIMFVYSTNKKTTSYMQVNSDALSAMERMTYEITGSQYIYLATSSFDNPSSGQLSLATEIYATANDDITYLDFYVDSNTLFLKKDGQDPVPLTSKNVSVSTFNVSYYKNGARESVKIDMTIQSLSNPSSEINLSNTVALRN